MCVGGGLAAGDGLKCRGGGPGCRLAEHGSVPRGGDRPVRAGAGGARPGLGCRDRRGVVVMTERWHVNGCRFESCLARGVARAEAAPMRCGPFNALVD